MPYLLLLRVLLKRFAQMATKYYNLSSVDLMDLNLEQIDLFKIHSWSLMLFLQDPLNFFLHLSFHHLFLLLLLHTEPAASTPQPSLQYPVSRIHVIYSSYLFLTCFIPGCCLLDVHT